MPLDGITAANIVAELKAKLLGGRVDKIYQPGRDEIVMQLRNCNVNYRLLITAQAAHPRLHITNAVKTNPENAPQFCMLLRKHLSGGRIVSVTQPEFERIVAINVESPNEMGDITVKNLIIEIMGKHSNIILTRDGFILDSIKRVPRETSSVREVLPGLNYVPPPSKNKKNPVNITEKEFYTALSQADMPIEGFVFSSYNGISPLVASEIAHRAGISPDSIAKTISVSAKTRLYTEFLKIMAQVVTERFEPGIYYSETGAAADFSSIRLSLYKNYEFKGYESVSALLDDFYTQKDAARVKAQKSADLKKLITQNIQRNARKYEQQLQTLKDIENRDNLKLYGELITSNIHNLTTGMTMAAVTNFYAENNPETEIPLDPALTPSENAQRYFKRYNKAKRTFLALGEQIRQTEDEKIYLEQLLQTISLCEDEADLNDIRQELYDEGYIKKQPGKRSKRSVKKSKPLHFISSDGFDIYVGKNNKQNEELTLKTASNSDIWLHTKTIPGAHIIIKTNGKPVPETTMDAATQLACYYSKGKDQTLVPIDYTLKKHVKKPPGAKTGMVIYENYKTAYVTVDEDRLPAPADV